jgi:hypothetical protein
MSDIYLYIYIGETTRVGQARALDASCKLPKVSKASGHGGGAGGGGGGLARRGALDAEKANLLKSRCPL